jgi:methionyl-tRNA formyltransferase
LATLAPPLKKEDGKIDWSFAAQKIYDRMRGFKPWPGTFSSFREKALPIVGKTGRQPRRTRSGSGRALSGAAPGSLFAVGTPALSRRAAGQLFWRSSRSESKEKNAWPFEIS